MNIKVLGTGCPKCKSLYNSVQDVLNANNINVEIEKVEDIMEIMTYDIMTTPALVINDKVVVKGRVPSKIEILEFLTNSPSDSNDQKSESSCCS